MFVNVDFGRLVEAIITGAERPGRAPASRRLDSCSWCSLESGSPRLKLPMFKLHATALRSWQASRSLSGACFSSSPRTGVTSLASYSLIFPSIPTHSFRPIESVGSPAGTDPLFLGMPVSDVFHTQFPPPWRALYPSSWRSCIGIRLGLTLPEASARTLRPDRAADDPILTPRRATVELGVGIRRAALTMGGHRGRNHVGSSFAGT